MEVLFYTSPAYKTYVSNLNKKQLDLTIKTVSKIASIYKNCTYFNLLQDRNFTSIDFRDADHLNHKGAKKLSLIINDLLSDLEVRNHNKAHKSLGNNK